MALYRRQLSPAVSVTSSLEMLAPEPPTPGSPGPGSMEASPPPHRPQRRLDARSNTAPPGGMQGPCAAGQSAGTGGALARSGGAGPQEQLRRCSTVAGGPAPDAPAVSPALSAQSAPQSHAAPRRRARMVEAFAAARSIDGSSCGGGDSPAAPSAAPSRCSALSARDVQRIRAELRRPLDYDPDEATVTLTRADIEALRDPQTLEFLAQTPGLARYVGPGQQGDTSWRHCSVFVTAVEDDGTPAAATIDEDAISLPVEPDLPAGARQRRSSRATDVADFLAAELGDGDDVDSQGLSQEEETDSSPPPQHDSASTASQPRGPRRPSAPRTRLQRAQAASVATPSEAGATAAVPGYMRGTASAASKRRDLLQEKEQAVERIIHPPPREQPPPDASTAGSSTPAPRRRRIKETSDGCFADRNRARIVCGTRRTFTEDEEARIDRLLADERFDPGADPCTQPLQLLPGEGYSCSTEDDAKEEQIAAALRRLRPDQDWDALLLPAPPQQSLILQQGEGPTPSRRKASVAAGDGDAPAADLHPDERRRQEQVARARGEALCVRPPRPEDWVAEMREERQHRQKLHDLNERLSVLYEAKGDEEQALRLDREYDEGETYCGRLEADSLQELLRAAAAEQGREVPAPVSDSDSPEDSVQLQAVADRRRQWEETPRGAGGGSVLAADPECLAEGGAAVSSAFSGYLPPGSTEEPQCPEELFLTLAQAAPRPPSSAAAGPARDSSSPPRQPAPAAPRPAAEAAELPADRKDFLSGDWDSLIARGADAAAAEARTLASPAQLERLRVSSRSPYPAPSSHPPTPKP
eukprot:TRINITY_DN17929_c0_g1_i2.p1 TRINITY_DN17929_c0_g1~~TRINITY_DN17929_c0_g1_i2.p1  ORF type:complete len:842 (+),score=172.53 TRINITY_DN17929_c0_g1_i2:89-2527(+)